MPFFMEQITKSATFSVVTPSPVLFSYPFKEETSKHCHMQSEACSRTKVDVMVQHTEWVMPQDRARNAQKLIFTLTIPVL